MTPIEITIYIISGIALLVLGAESLIRGGVGIAVKLGIAPLVIGLTIVAFGTSTPELVVSVNAAINGNGDISLGNVIGSNICNIALILGIAALINPLEVKIQVIRKEIPIMIGSAFLLLIFMLDGSISRIEGLVLFAGIVVYTAFSYYSALKEKNKETEKEFEDIVSKPAKNVNLMIIFILAGLGFLILGSKLFVDGAVELATKMGVSHAVIGLTVVALGTSLPELFTAAIASFKKEGDIAIGNVIGSNIFNILAILGITASIVPLNSSGIKTRDLLIMLGVSILLLPLLRSGFKLNRWEGLLLLTGYFIYIYFMLP